MRNILNITSLIALILLIIACFGNSIILEYFIIGLATFNVIGYGDLSRENNRLLFPTFCWFGGIVLNMFILAHLLQQ